MSETDDRRSLLRKAGSHSATTCQTTDNLAVDDLTYALRPEVEIVPFDCSTPNVTFQVFGNGHRVGVTSAGADLFEFLRRPRTQSDIEQYALDCKLEGTGQGLVTLLDKPPYKYFLESSGSPTGADRAKTSKPFLLLKLDLLPSKTVMRITQPLEFLFRPLPSLLCCMLIVVIHIAFVLFGGYKHPYTLSFTQRQWIMAWIGAYAAVFVHELGHCTACTRYRSRPGAVGFGLYLIWPVLYADTNDSWRLDRRHRAIVDIAGIYFHLIASAACILTGYLLHSPVLFVISKSAILATAINLNPFFRFDGYWLITDLTGIPNIREASSQFWQFVVHSAFNPATNHPTPKLLQIVPKVRLLFAVYCVFSLVFFGNVFIRVLRILPHRIASVPFRFGQVCHLIELQPTSFAALKAAVLLSLFLIGVAQTSIFAARRAMRGYRGMRSFVTKVRGRNLSSRAQDAV
jgi:putative peptide zinc metalloprotease protein